jgi:hypothetical protein
MTVQSGQPLERERMTAKALGVTFPADMLSIADEVIA